MAHLVVRRLLIELETGFPRQWAGGDAFVSAWFNALSMSFPIGEQFFIDSVREGVKTLPQDAQLRFADEIKGFIGQEATHRRIHALFNAQLDKQGLVNSWEKRLRRRFTLFDKVEDLRHRVAVTAATEHFTAILAHWMLSNPQVLAGAEPRLQAMWMWHSAEESEHRSTAFDLYQAMGGNHAWRIRWFRRVSRFFAVDVLRQTVRNLWNDGTLFRWRTLRSACRFLFSRHGMVRQVYGPWKAYLAADFHPRQQDDALAHAWLRDNAARLSPVGE